MKPILFLLFVVVIFVSCSSSTDVSTFDVVITRNAEAKAREDLVSSEKELDKIRENLVEIKRICDQADETSLSTVEVSNNLKSNH